MWAIVVILLIACLLWIVLGLVNPIGHLLGPVGLDILNRLFGLILTATAAAIMANGLRILLPAVSG